MKRIILILTFLLLTFCFYNFVYVDYWWNKYIDKEFSLSAEIRYGFQPINNHRDIPITETNFRDFTWKREIFESDHATWRVQKITFPNDSSIEISHNIKWLDFTLDGYLYPLTGSFFFEKNTFEYASIHGFDISTMEMVYYVVRDSSLYYFKDEEMYFYRTGDEFKRQKTEFKDGIFSIPWIWI